MPIRPTRSHFGIRAAATFALVLLASVATSPAMRPAMAANLIFPTGSRIGIVPLAGMVTSHNFVGFEDPQKNAAILFTTLPAKAYDALDKSMVPDAMKRDGVDIEKREPIELGIGKGFLLTGTQVTNNTRYRKWLLVTAAGNITALVTIQVPDKDPAYSDKAMHDTLMTLAVRDSVPDAEQLSLMPFSIGDLAGFHVGEVLPGRAVMLVDRDPDQGKNEPADPSSFKARLFIAAVPGAPAEPSDRNNFARTVFQQIIGIKEVRVQDAEPLRIGSQPGFETLAKAKDSQSNADVMVVQWLRFGTAGFLQMVGIVHADTWPTEFTRLRTIRDSIDPR
jgi:hypothetical protein